MADLSGTIKQLIAMDGKNVKHLGSTLPQAEF